MRRRDDASDGGGPDRAGASEPEVGPDRSPKMVVRGGAADADPTVMSAADTAVASQSTTMAAQSGSKEPESLIGETLLGRYQITRKVGQGGMGAVYEATHTLIGKRVAVKVLLDRYAQKNPIVARLEQEARLASSIGHEHIIDITDFGQTSDGRTFVVMEFLEGDSLHEVIAREGPLPEQRVLRIARQIASALGAAHQKGVIHRDVKPENVFLLRRSEQDFAKVVDFGISKSVRPLSGDGGTARLTQTGMVLGTPLYMSPEQARGDEETDHRIDVYALGVIMYEMATGEVPFRGNNYLNVISQVINEEPRPPRELRPELSEELELVILRAMDKDVAYRYASMQELAADLATLEETPQTSSGRARITLPRLRRKPGRRRRKGLRMLGWAAGIAVISSAVAVTVTVTMSGGSGAGAPEPQPAQAAQADAGASAEEPAPPPEVEVVHIPIESDPPGALIYEGGRLIGPTPTVYKAARENRDLELSAELEGHRRSTFRVNPYLFDPETDEAVRVRLIEHRDRDRGPRRPGRRPRPNRRGAD